ncbi:hypothetical protein FRC05_005416 [Tulasnella sp. 425]|nr:hypothetical protein FRC05_005416 [Tulasnella sp. 425]
MNSKPSVGQPPTQLDQTVTFSPPRLRQITRSRISNLSFHQRLEDAKNVAISILRETNWPRRSYTAAQELLEAIEQSPNVKGLSENHSIEPEDLQDAVDQFATALRELKTKLDHLADNYGIRKRSIRERIKYFLAMLRGVRCTRMLQIYKDDVSKASKSVTVTVGSADVQGYAVFDDDPSAPPIVCVIGNNIPGTLTGEARDATSTPAERPADSQGPAGPNIQLPVLPEGQPSGSPYTQDATPTSAERAVDSQGPAVADSPTPASPKGQPSDSPNSQAQNAGRREGLDVIKKVFSAVEITSGVIPALGEYIVASAKVGLTCVEIAQVMYDNNGAAEELMSRTTELSKLLQPFDQRLYEPEKEAMIRLVRNLQWQLQLVRSEIEKLRSDSNFVQFVSFGERADNLKEWEQRIRATMDDIQLVINFKTADHGIDICQFNQSYPCEPS